MWYFATIITHTHKLHTYMNCSGMPLIPKPNIYICIYLYISIDTSHWIDLVNVSMAHLFICLNSLWVPSSRSPPPGFSWSLSIQTSQDHCMSHQQALTWAVCSWPHALIGYHHLWTYIDRKKKLKDWMMWFYIHPTKLVHWKNKSPRIAATNHCFPTWTPWCHGSGFHQWWIWDQFWHLAMHPSLWPLVGSHKVYSTNKGPHWPTQGASKTYA